MGPRVHFLELLDAHFSVNLSCLEFCVPQELLDKADVGPAFEHVRSAGVPEEVATAASSNVGLLDISTHFAA